MLWYIYIYIYIYIFFHWFPFSSVFCFVTFFTVPNTDCFTLVFYGFLQFSSKIQVFSNLIAWLLWYSHDQLYKHICMQNRNDDKIKTSDTVIRKIYLSLYLKGLCMRESWRPNRTAAYWLPLLWPSAFLSRSPRLLNWGLRPSLSGCWFSLPDLSPTRLIHDCLIGDLRAPSTGCWLSLPHLVSNSSDPQLQLLNRGPEALLCWVLAFSTASCLQLVWSPTATAQSGAWGPTLLGAGFLLLIEFPVHWVI